MKRKVMGLPAAVVAVLLGAEGASAATNTLSGSIAGVVSNALGIPQMGATVTLYNRLERQVARSLTDDRGLFQFESLPADVYSVRVALPAFVTAIRDNIGVQPGIRRILSINLTGLLSSIELVYSLPVTQGLISDDWKWALRSSLATRPILRVLSADARDPLQRMRSGSSWFSHTRGVVKLSAGDMAVSPTLGSQPDLGTAFALATSFLGSNNLQFSGNLGYSAQSGNPAAGIRTTFSRQLGEGRTPEVAVTMRQLFLANRVGAGILSGDSSTLPAMRTMSVGVSDRVQLSDNFALSYGATMESVQFIDRLNYISPYASVAYSVEDIGTLEFGFSSGIPDAQFYSKNGPHGENNEHSRELSGVSLFPRVSLRGGHARVQRAENFEVGFRKTAGSRTYSLGAYREAVSNVALMAVGAGSDFSSSELLPDLFSTGSIVNAGRYHTVGYMASVQQNLNENWTVTGAYGKSGVLEAMRETLRNDDPQGLQGLLSAQRRHWLNARVSGLLGATGTRFTTSYQFMNGKALTPGHFYMTQRQSPEQGLNLYIRQPIPALGGRNTKLEATAEIRNMLAQGYQPISTLSGQKLYLVHSPRALRGGLAFIF